MKVAIVHDWLVTYAGAERALEQILAIYSQADLYSVVDFLPAEDRFMLQGRVPRTSFIQSLPFARRRYRSYLPLMPLAVKWFDLSGYDLVISSSHAVAKGAPTGPGHTTPLPCPTTARSGGKRRGHPGGTVAWDWYRRGRGLRWLRKAGPRPERPAWLRRPGFGGYGPARSTLATLRVWPGRRPQIHRFA